MRFHRLTFTCLFLLAITATAWAQNVEKRVLFVVETSKDSKPLAEAERKLVSALIKTGLGGLLDTNDTFGIWTFNETLHYGKFPVQRWSRETAERSAGQASAFLKGQTYEKLAKLDSVNRPLQTVIQSSPALMVVLVTSGKRPISGTPFDAEINKELKSAYRNYQKQKTPAVIMLSSTSGKILRYSVNPAIGDVRVPLLTIPTNTVAKVTQPPVVQNIPKAPAPVAPVARAEGALLITKGGAQTVSVAQADKVAEERPLTTPIIPTAPLPALEDQVAVLPPRIISTSTSQETFTPQVVPPSAPIVAEEPKPVAPPIEVAQLPKTDPVEVPKPIEAAPPVAPPIATPAPVQPEVVKPSQPAPVVEQPRPSPEPATPPAPVVPPVAAKEIAPAALPVSAPPSALVVSNDIKVAETPPSSAASPVAQPEPILAQAAPEGKRPFPFLIVAGGLIALAIALAFLIGRQTSRKPQQSLVSDWAERDRLKKD